MCQLATSQIIDNTYQMAIQLLFKITIQRLLIHNIIKAIIELWLIVNFPAN